MEIKFTTKTIISTAIAFCFITASLLLSACQNTAGIKVEHGEKTTVNNAQFENNLSVEQVIGAMKGELYSATVTIKNQNTSTKTLQYQFTWYDGQNIEVDSDSHGWTPVTIYGNDEKTLSDVAPSPDATQFKVSVRELNATKVFKTNFFGRI